MNSISTNPKVDGMHPSGVVASPHPGYHSSGRGTTRAENAPGTPTQSRISPGILECTKKMFWESLIRFWALVFREGHAPPQEWLQCQARWFQRVPSPQTRDLRKRYRGTSLIGKHTPIGPCRRPMPRVLGGVLGGWAFSYGRGTHDEEQRPPLGAVRERVLY